MNTQQIVVGALETEERKEIVQKTLWEYRKKLDDRQMKQLLSKQDAHKPLYLIVGTCAAISTCNLSYIVILACEELRVFGVYEMVSERIGSMAQTVPALFEEVQKSNSALPASQCALSYTGTSSS